MNIGYLASGFPRSEHTKALPSHPEGRVYYDYAGGSSTGYSKGREPPRSGDSGVGP